ncbi:hypothetical protein [Fluviicola sp.]|jgi:hypothetical protein|uniref:hypothetical protein n=1 Tax=Fluviicola sp. TaxID=1917219 RepID=UPI002822533C|nr:hypothetical protein [Fluviicola sp.]MDR0801391.1 hypothetical protein [Fluviicola sp.]
MITLQQKIKHLSKLLIVLLLSSCASTKIIELGGKAATTGAEVSQKALDIFTILSQQADIDKSQQDKIKILTHPSPATMTLPDTKTQDFSNQLSARVKAYQNLLNTYKVFTLLTDNKYSDKTQEAVSALQESYNSIEKLPNLPTTVSEKLPEVSKLITQAIQAKKIKAHNQILFSLTQLYIKLWDEDQKIWNDYLDRIYDDYSTGLNTVDSKRYDSKKISELSKEPYSDEATIILMYRLEKRDEITRQKNAIKKQLNDFGKSLKELNKVHAEISKSKTDISDVTKMINSIENLLIEK